MDPAKLAALSAPLAAAVQAARLAKVEGLFEELRAGFLPAELSRLRGLLPPESDDSHSTAISAVSKMVAELRSDFAVKR